MASQVILYNGELVEGNVGRCLPDEGGQLFAVWTRSEAALRHGNDVTKKPIRLACTAFCRIIVDVMAQEIQTTARLEARLPNEVYALLKRAAEIEGRTLTDFVVSAARAAACRTIEETKIMRLSVEDQRQIAEALLNPPEPTPALKKAFQRRRELLGLE